MLGEFGEKIAWPHRLAEGTPDFPKEGDESPVKEPYLINSHVDEVFDRFGIIKILECLSSQFKIERRIKIKSKHLNKRHYTNIVLIRDQ